MHELPTGAIFLFLASFNKEFVYVPSEREQIAFRTLSKMSIYDIASKGLGFEHLRCFLGLSIGLLIDRREWYALRKGCQMLERCAPRGVPVH